MHCVIKDWDLSDVKRYLREHKGMDAYYVDQLETEYKRYMSLVVMHHPLSFSISEEVDEMWHTHILFTQDYVKMSRACGFDYLHHIPLILNPEGEEVAEAYRRTVIFYEKEWGSVPTEFWQPDKWVCLCNCASCTEDMQLSSNVAIA